MCSSTTPPVTLANPFADYWQKSADGAWRIAYELNAEGPMPEDTMTRRRLPGDGTFDLVGLVRALDSIGVDVPYSVEILSTEHQALPVDEQARRAYDSTAALLELSRR